jgi:GntR family transcriptional regulator
MDISIDIHGGVPIYRQIANQIRYMIASGLLKPDEELPPIRTLAIDLRVTPNTVVKAYEELEHSGVITKKRGSGCFVSEGQSKLADREKRRIIEQRIDALLTESRQMNIKVDDLFKLIHKRLAAMNISMKQAGEG